ncbi:MAG: HNH endonuclease [Thermoleophilia bacterium]
MLEHDDALRSACFLALDVLRARFGAEVPYRGGLELGFAFEGGRIPFLSPAKGIFRARAQRGPAALSVMTSARSPYDDEETDEGFWYAFRDGAPELADNRALRAAHELGVPIVYFIGLRPGWFEPVAPCWVVDRDLRRVLIAPSPPGITLAERAPEGDERRYATREVRRRLHQGRFRGLVLPAYSDRCAVCSLRERRLLDAAHILADGHRRGEPVVPNGLSLCSIHHRAYDEDLIGIDPDHRVHVSRALLEDQDGPMLELLKTFHGTRIAAPTSKRLAPDPMRLAERFERFQAG